MSRVRPYNKSEIPGQEPEPAPPVEIEGELEYEVEEILDSRVYRRQFQYLIKWKGYTAEHNSWEPVSNVGNAKDAISEFHRKHPSAPRRIQLMKQGMPLSQEEFAKLFKPFSNYTDTPAHHQSRLNMIEEDLSDQLLPQLAQTPPAAEQTPPKTI